MITTINNEHKKVYVPNLRFPEFEGEWEKCKLLKICTFFSGGTPSSSNKDFYGGNIPFIRSGELHADSTELFITQAGFDSSSAKMVEIGDLLLAMYGATSGDIAVSKIKGAINQAILCIRTKQNKKFIESVWNKHVSKNLRKYLQGGQGNLSADIIKGISFSFPTLKEQEKIANLVSLLDERIATQNKIIDKLQTLIKGLEDNLLDNPLWEKTYLRSFMQFFSTNSLSWEQLSYEEGEIRNLHYGLIHGFQTRSINSVSLPMIKNEAIPKQYTLCQVGDVAFADASEDTGEIAKSVEFVDTIEGDTICGLHTIHGRDIKNRTVVGFKGFAFNSRYFHNQIKRLAQGTKVFSITANNLSSCYVYLPDFDTQKAIVKLLKAYEEKLLVSKRLLEQYEKQKQYLLRQMFI
ncbi:restriction endonuclease subunit S [Leyella stercorea]|uniref:Restriction endonuclease subunit S n=1 Tax=Leyella stercorea TaxID=363265 RepID=A0A3R6JEE4_9BACT|nr:restriction endonuclease subunit S [Leyella stercorea]